MTAAGLFKYISRRRLPQYSIKENCQILSVSESGYYRFIERSKHATKEDELLAQIKEIRAEAPENENYGFKRMHLALAQRDIHKSICTVYRCMKRNNLLVKAKRNPNGITASDRAAQKSENLIKRDFSAENPNEKYLTDITEVPCRDGKLYVAPVMDCFDGQIVGLSMDDNMRKELCIRAVADACNSQNAKGMILHSDRGSQYTSGDFRNCLAKYGITQSMSGTGKCYDNARMESFFATLKKEKLFKIKTEKMSMNEVKTVIWRYIMLYYNRVRIYTRNPQGLPPASLRAAYLQNAVA